MRRYPAAWREQVVAGISPGGERIVAAILAGQPDAASAAMLEHLAGSEALMRGFLG